VTIKNAMAIVPLFFSLLAAMAAQETTNDKPQLTIFPHGESRFSISGQLNFILQGHGRFPALNSGPNSLKDTPVWKSGAGRNCSLTWKTSAAMASAIPLA